jgi:hypothetical protein
VARVTRTVGLLVTFVVASAVFSACGTGGALADAKQSCVDVKRALAIEARSNAAGLSPTQRTRLQANALSQLLKATPSAAAATSADGSWNPLMTTINEAERVPLPFLIPTLTRLCTIADSSTPYI